VAPFPHGSPACGEGFRKLEIKNNGGVVKMPRRVEVELPDRLYEKVREEVESGNYATVSEVIRTALRKLLEQ